MGQEVAAERLGVLGVGEEARDDGAEAGGLDFVRAVGEGVGDGLLELLGEAQRVGLAPRRDVGDGSGENEAVGVEASGGEGLADVVGEGQTGGVIVTGDDDLLSLKSYEGVRIVKPRTYWEEFSRRAKP